jgi:hypothetical protein
MRGGLLLAVLLAGLPARASGPRHRLAPQVCEAEQRPAVTALAVPQSVRASAHHLEMVERSRRGDRGPRTRRSGVVRWVVVVAVVAAASVAIALAR